jgi:putative endonuclease
MKNNRLVGQSYEEKAVKFLIENGYRILHKNFRCRLGEIDIIGQDGPYLVFIEVKYRKDRRKGNPAEAVHFYKQRTITKVAQYYFLIQALPYETPCRFDVVMILKDDIQLLKNAFDAIN